MEDKFNDFFTLNNGKYVEKVDSTNYAQCFDLAVAWCEFLGLPTSIFSGLLYAYQIFTQPTSVAKENFDFIKNTEDAYVQKGDMVVFGTGVGTAGHVSIASKNINQYTFESFDQNWGSPKYCRLITHNYDNDDVLGWLRFKGQMNSSSDALTACLKAHKEAVDSATQKDTLIDALNKQIIEKNANIVSVQGELRMLADKLELCQQQVDMNSECSKALLEERQKTKLLEDQKAEWIEQEQSYIKQIKTLQTNFDKIKSTLIPKKYLSLKIYNLIMAIEGKG